MATAGTHPDDACAPDARNGSPASQATVNSLTLAKGASLAGVTMNATSHAPHPPNLVEVQTLLNRVPSLARAQVPKVPSLMELNARAQSPAAVKMIPPGSQAPFPAHPAPTVPALSEREENEEAPAPCAGKVCANCRTTKTPLWRNGPLGPKTLCNACGVRFKLGKLPPPGGWPPGHVPPPPPPRKRPSNASSNGEKGANKRVKHARAGEGAGEGTLKSHPRGPAEGRKKGWKPSLIGAGGPDGEYLKARFGGPGRPTLTDYDGAVLLMVLAGMYD